jgi:uroporphyrinogen decarboxylase
MPAMTAERFTNARNRVAQAVPPVWLMRQAGRYQRHYQELRARHSFEELCHEPELAAEVALGSIRDFDFDVAILFSDLLFSLEALGFSLRYDDRGPHLAPRLDRAVLDRLRGAREAAELLTFQQRALEYTRARLEPDKSLIGFIGGPWTLFVYAVEGTHSGNQREAKAAVHLFQPFCEELVALLVENVRMQLEGGAEIVMMFDTAAGGLTPAWYQRTALPAALSIAAEFPGKIGYYGKYLQPAHFRPLDNRPAAGAEPRAAQDSLAGIGIDCRWDLLEAFTVFDRGGFVQGNFDEALLCLPVNQFRSELHGYLEPLVRLAPERRRGWVCGAGHGVPPDALEANVRLFVQTVREVFA